MAKNESRFTPHADDSRVTVRQSYYTFSKDYPAGQIEIAKRRKKKPRAASVLRVCLLVILFAALVGAAFFATDLALRISNRPEDTSAIAATAVEAPDLSAIKGMEISAEAISNRSALRKTIRTLRRKDCNTVVLNFKAADGRLLYTSTEALAIEAKCSIYDNETVREALQQFQRANIQVFACVTCFDDPRIAAVDPSLAVKYLDTDVPWLDALEENGGKPWLNPYATGARAYLKAIISEIAAFGVQGVILKALSFPTGDNLETATFPGEANSVNRNILLKNLISSIKNELPDGCALLIGVGAEDLLLGSHDLYGGDLFPNHSDGILCDTARRSEEYIYNKKEKFSSMLSLFSALRLESDAQTLVFEIPQDEATNAYLRALKRGGVHAIVIDSES